MLGLLACGSAVSPEPVQLPPLPVADQDIVRFVAIGDQGEGNASQRLVAQSMREVCAERGCDFAMLLGDNVYPRGLESADDPVLERLYDPYYPALERPVLAVLGNHDYGDSRDQQRARWQVDAAASHDNLVLPELYYQVRAGQAELWALDTTALFWGRHTRQLAWLDASVAASDAKWKVAFGHHPYRSDGPHGNAGQYEGWSFLPVASGRRLEALFEEQLCGEVDLYLSGHDHTLQWIEHCGTHWVVSGAGSKATEVIDRDNGPRFAAAQEGLAWIELGERLTVAFYDQHGAKLFEGSADR